MPAQVGLPFAATFVFARSVPAVCRDASGALVTRAANVARFDHAANGVSLGLIVGTGEAFGQHDAVRAKAGDWEDEAASATILHEYEIDGVIVRTAIHSDRPRAAINGCLRVAARHRLIGAVPGFLPNLGGFVRFRAVRYELGDALGEGSTAIGDTENRPLIES